MNQYSYATDAEFGKIKAESLEKAYFILESRITDEMMENGAQLWVSEEDGSIRIELVNK